MPYILKFEVSAYQLVTHQIQAATAKALTTSAIREADRNLANNHHNRRIVSAALQLKSPLSIGPHSYSHPAAATTTTKASVS